MSLANHSADRVQNIGILGAGQMGTAAAVPFRRTGFCVRLWTRRNSMLRPAAAAMDTMDTFLDEHLGATATPGGTLILEPDLAVVDTTSDAVLECIAEEMPLKQNLLAQRAPHRLQEPVTDEPWYVREAHQNLAGAAHHDPRLLGLCPRAV